MPYAPLRRRRRPLREYWKAPVPIPTAPKALEPSNPIYAYKKTGTFRVGFFDCPYFRTEGSQVAMPGTKQRRAISRTIITAKGAAPTMMS